MMLCVARYMESVIFASTLSWIAVKRLTQVNLTNLRWHFKERYCFSNSNQIICSLSSESSVLHRYELWRFTACICPDTHRTKYLNSKLNYSKILSTVCSKILKIYFFEYFTIIFSLMFHVMPTCQPLVFSWNFFSFLKDAASAGKILWSQDPWTGLYRIQP